MSYESILAELNATPLHRIEFGKGFREFSEKLRQSIDRRKNTTTTEKQDVIQKSSQTENAGTPRAVRAHRIGEDV